MHSKIAALILPVLAAAYPQSNAPGKDDITIVDTTYSGNGCPQGSVSTSTSEDKTVSTFQHSITPTILSSGSPKYGCRIHTTSTYQDGAQPSR